MNVVYDMVYGLTFSNTDTTSDIHTSNMIYAFHLVVLRMWVCVVLMQNWNYNSCEASMSTAIRLGMSLHKIYLYTTCMEYRNVRTLWRITIYSDVCWATEQWKKKMLRWFSEMDSPCQTIRNHAKANFRNYSNHSENMRGGPFQHALPLVTKIIIFHPHIVARLACG